MIAAISGWSVGNNNERKPNGDASDWWKFNLAFESIFGENHEILLIIFQPNLCKICQKIDT